MRPIRKKQLSFSDNLLAFDQARELESISGILDDHPTVGELVWQDLAAAGLAKRGDLDGSILSGEQVLRALVIKQLNGFSFRELAFHLSDSSSYRRFCQLGWSDAPSKSTLAGCIKAVRAETLEAINRIFVGYASKSRIEDGKKVRVDTTVVESNIHAPLDSSLLLDSVRVLTRVTRELVRELGSKHVVPNRGKRAKRRALGILNARNMEARKPLYKDLLVVTTETLKRARTMITVADRAINKARGPRREKLIEVRARLDHYAGLATRVLDQTRRRVLGGESVPASEKVVSIFEDHADVIVKDRRETLYGHKVCLSTGKSSLIIDCKVLDGNPADSTLAEDMIDRHIQITGNAPRQAAYDGGFTSRSNLESLKIKGVTDVVFSKAKHLEVADMARSTGKHQQVERYDRAPDVAFE